MISTSTSPSKILSTAKWDEWGVKLWWGDVEALRQHLIDMIFELNTNTSSGDVYPLVAKTRLILEEMGYRNA
jgi:hypothetical protein